MEDLIFLSDSSLLIDGRAIVVAGNVSTVVILLVIPIGPSSKPEVATPMSHVHAKRVSLLHQKPKLPLKLGNLRPPNLLIPGLPPMREPPTINLPPKDKAVPPRKALHIVVTKIVAEVVDTYD